MDSTVSVSNQTSDEISLYGLFSLFIKNWLTLSISGFSVAAIALVWSLYQPNIYKAETLLMPASDNGGGLSSLAGNLGGLASNNNFNEQEEKYKRRHLI